jgi:hypothetical protein
MHKRNIKMPFTNGRIKLRCLMELPRSSKGQIVIKEKGKISD